MDDIDYGEIGRQKSNHYKAIHMRWMIPPHQTKDHHTMKIMAELDNALELLNKAISEKKEAMLERDMAFSQRDTAIAERDQAISERNSVVAALQFAHESAADVNGEDERFRGCSATQAGIKHSNWQYLQHVSHIHLPPQLSDTPYNHEKEMRISEPYRNSSMAEVAVKPLRSRRPREERKDQAVPSRKAAKLSRKKRRGAKDSNPQVTFAKANGELMDREGNRDDINKAVSAQHEWRGYDLGLNQVNFDETMLPAPGCSCTGVLHQCYKWGNGGWQSACCTRTMSMYPLPMMQNKRHSRVGGRKMSGGAFAKLLNRMVREGCDLSMPLDLKNHWAKHGTNRYITIR